MKTKYVFMTLILFFLFSCNKEEKISSESQVVTSSSALKSSSSLVNQKVGKTSTSLTENSDSIMIQNSSLKPGENIKVKLSQKWLNGKYSLRDMNTNELISSDKIKLENDMITIPTLSSLGSSKYELEFCIRCEDSEVSHVLVLSNINSSIPKVDDRDWRRPFRLGFNSIKTTDMKSIDSNEKEYDTMEKVLKAVAKVGGQGVRHLNDNDISWFRIYNGRGLENKRNFSFSLTDEVTESPSNVYFIPTLFMQGPPTQARYFGYEDETSCGDGTLEWTPHVVCRWPRHPDATINNNIIQNDKDKLLVNVNSVEDKVKGYLNAVADYFDEKDLYHFEVGNEWERFPKRWQVDEIGLVDWRWNPGDYGNLLELVSETLKNKNSKNKVVMGGLFSSPDTDLEELWFEQTIKKFSKGDVPFDVISFHHYDTEDALSEKITFLKDLREEREIEDVPLWLTEFGSSATEETEVDQVKNMVKQMAIAFYRGVELVIWHTFVSKHDGKDNWGGYGIIPNNRINGGDESSSNDRDRYRSYYVYELLSNKIGNFDEVKAYVVNGFSLISMFSGSGEYLIRFSGALYSEWGEEKEVFIAWGKEGSKLDLQKQFLINGKNVTKVKVTKLMPDTNGVFDRWKTTSLSSFEVGEVPYLIEIVE